MKNIAFGLILAVGLALPAETILDIDFTKDLAPLDHSTVGTCRSNGER